MKQGMCVVIDSEVVSEVDGKPGTVVGWERGWVEVKLAQWQSVMRFRPHELKELR